MNRPFKPGDPDTYSLELKETLIKVEGSNLKIGTTEDGLLALFGLTELLYFLSEDCVRFFAAAAAGLEGRTREVGEHRLLMLKNEPATNDGDDGHCDFSLPAR